MNLKKTVLKTLINTSLGVSFSACSQINTTDLLNTVKSVATVPTTETPVVKALTSGEITNGLKEALTRGAKIVTENVSKADGFNANSLIRLPFPPDAIEVKEKLIKMGMEKKVAEFETTLNRAAEESSKKAFIIFSNAVRDMTIADGAKILKGEKNAATLYLKSKTTAELKAAFQPIVAEALNTVQVTKYWTPLINTYNKIPFTEDKDPDLEKYVIERALQGIFTLVEKEEAKIRLDPMARVTDVLKKVFSSLD